MNPSAMDIDGSPPCPSGLLPDNSSAIEVGERSAPLEKSARRAPKPKTLSQTLCYQPRIPRPVNHADYAVSVSMTSSEGDSGTSFDTKPDRQQQQKQQSHAESGLTAPISVSISSSSHSYSSIDKVPLTESVTSITATASHKHYRSRSSFTPVPEGTFRFKKCPAEVRNQIYALLVVSHSPLVTTSPPNRRQKREGAREPTMECAIMCVDKQISAEARTVFFTHNTFAFGTGRYGAIYEANVHGLQVFTELMPRQSLRAIKRVELHIYLPAGWLQETIGGANRDFVEQKHQAELEILGGVLGAEFEGVESLTVEFVTEGPKNAKWGLTPRGWNKSVRIAVDMDRKLCALRDLLQLARLKRVILVQRGSQLVLNEFARMVREVNGLDLYTDDL
ncbi:unnamed protein product [Diplocarpon coronariae]